MTTTAPNIPPLETLVKNVWFWVGILGLALVLYITWSNGVFKGIGKCAETTK